MRRKRDEEWRRQVEEQARQEAALEQARIREEEARRVAAVAPAQAVSEASAVAEEPSAPKPQAATDRIRVVVPSAPKPVPVSQPQKQAPVRAAISGKPAVAEPPKAAPAKPKVSVARRLRRASSAIRGAFARIPWQVWRTLAGVIVLALVFYWISRACSRMSDAPPAPARQAPLVEKCHPAPEPYLD